VNISINKTLVLAIALMAVISLEGIAQELPEFNNEVLASWNVTEDLREITPYVTERTQANFLWGAISKNGTYIYVQLSNDTQDSWAITAPMMLGMMSASDVSDWNVSAYSTRWGSIPVGDDLIDVIIVEMNGMGSGYDFSSGDTVPTHYKSAIIPFVYGTKGASKNYKKSFLMVEYRGKSEFHENDSQAFEELLQNLEIPNSKTRVILPGHANDLVQKKKLSFEAGNPEDEASQEYFADFNTTEFKESFAELSPPEETDAKTDSGINGTESEEQANLLDLGTTEEMMDSAEFALLLSELLDKPVPLELQDLNILKSLSKVKTDHPLLPLIQVRLAEERGFRYSQQLEKLLKKVRNLIRMSG
jgi:hypothetical protein